MRLRGALALTFLVAFPAMMAGQAPRDTTGAIVGVIVAGDSHEPLAYSIASIEARHLERLANDRGEVVFRNLAPGDVQVFIRHLGYSPQRVTVRVRAGATDTIRVALARLAVALEGVQVNAMRECTRPGPPNASAQPAFAAIFAQLEQNADAYRLLAAQYPFTYDMERRSVVRYVGGDESLQHLDTIRVGTGTRWHYAPGDVVDIGSDPRNRQVIFNIPSLIHFAEPAFLDNHCFFYGGRERVARGRDTVLAYRVDFLAAGRLRDPDVDGTIDIDPATYQIIRSMLRLTKIPDETPQIATVTVTTTFRTIVPSIAIARTIESVHRLKVDTTRAILPSVAFEVQRLVGVRFLGARPGG